MDNREKLSLPMKVTIIGCVIGLLFAGFGLFKQIDSKRINKERHDEALKQSQKMVDAANERLTEIEKEYNKLKDQYNAKEQECDSMNSNMLDPNWFTSHSQCKRESSDLYSKMTDLEQEKFEINNKNYTVYYDEVEPMSYYIFYIIGSSVAGLALLGAFIIYLVKGKKSY